jgi:hypothetical protein
MAHLLEACSDGRKPHLLAAVNPRTPRHIDVLIQGLRHLQFLLDPDASAADVMTAHWPAHLRDLGPALAAMYGEAAQTARRWRTPTCIHGWRPSELAFFRPLWAWPVPQGSLHEGAVRRLLPACTTMQHLQSGSSARCGPIG